MANYLEVSSTPSDEFSTLTSYQSATEVPKMWSLQNRTGYQGDKSYISQVNKNIMVNSSATISNYGALAGGTVQSRNANLSRIGNDNGEMAPYITAPSSNYFTYARENDTR